MGKRIIPPHDPARLKVVMDEKTRMYGVDVKELELQAAAHHRAAAAEERLKQQLDYQQEQWAQEVERRVHAVETCRRANESAVAAQQRRQAADKCERDQALREQHRNRISDAYFAQFGTSHR